MAMEQKSAKSVGSIPGTIVNHQNNQLLTSSGISGLDDLLGGGLPVGSLILLEEDESGSYSKTISKYFIAEGVASKHSTFLASQDISTESLVRELPAVIELDSEPDTTKHADIEEMKIAFRYHYLPTSTKSRSSEIGHHYDLTKSMPADMLKGADILHWKLDDKLKGPNTFCNAAYHDLLQNIHKKIKDGQFSLDDVSKKSSILRIALNSLGSPMWFGMNGIAPTILEQGRDLNMFIYCLRALIKSAYAVALVTIPSHLIEKESIDRCIHSSDIAFKLQAFAGTPLENNPALSDYNGYFQLLKFAPINSFVSKHPGSGEYAFKLRRKKFSIEKLHLPPDLDALEKNHAPTLGCASSDKHLLEF